MNATPVRVQRKRTKGFKLQEASPNGLPVVYVGRPTKYGNKHKMTDMRPPNEKLARELAVVAYENDLRRELEQNPHFLDPLKGKNLACWCPLQDKNGNSIPCHADIIIKIMKERGIN
jgi:hypothetical protein